MKFTLSWLQQYTATGDLTAAQLADRLTMLGLEVDSIEEVFADLDHIITAKITAVEKHPDADKLTVCQVDTGKETAQIVCGAPNVRAGMITALAQPGVRLPDGTKIKKSKMRGVVSAGMLCSARELGLSEDHSGIMDLSTDDVGSSLPSALGLRDTVIEVDLTPNRSDCASVRGIAREVGAITGSGVKPLVEAVRPLAGEALDYSIEIKDSALCPRYTAIKITGVKIGPSPEWMQRRLAAVGMRPINNIVDITNYVMLESGQPLHAFDFATLREQKIIVRRPDAGEQYLTTLDGNKRSLDPEMLLICDGQGPIAVAGVMGGLETEITESSTTVLLESACFNPISIRRTARKLGIPSEASYRFERGVDPDLADKALQRAADLIAEFGGGSVESDGLDLYPGKEELLTLTLRVSRVGSLLGVSLTQEQIAAYLTSIEFSVTPLDEETLEVIVPSFRIDIEREIDLIEEIARLYGYDAIPTTQPLIRMDSAEENPTRALRKEIAALLTAQGFFEAVNYSFVTERHLDLCGLSQDDQRRQMTRLLNPMTEEQAVLRTMLLPGLLENIKRNINFQSPDIRLFETGKVFFQRETGQLPEERPQLCLVLSGMRVPRGHEMYYAGQMADYYDAKGAIANVVDSLRLAGGEVQYVPMVEAIEPYCEPETATALQWGKSTLGIMGAVHSETLKNFGIKQPVYFVEIDLLVLQGLQRAAKQFTALPRFPSIKRDISLVIPEEVPAGKLLEAVYAKPQKYLESADIFDVYRGKPIQAGYKSVALSITYRSTTATLDDKSVDKVHDKIVNSLMAAFNARYREGSE